jgi:hypothetical protein
MTHIRFRLLRIGSPSTPVEITPVWEEAGGYAVYQVYAPLWFEASKPLDQLEAADLPRWLQEQNLPLELLPVQDAVGASSGAAFQAMLDAAENENPPAWLNHCQRTTAG